MGKENYLPEQHEQPSSGFRILIPGTEHAQYATTVSEWTRHAGTMLPKKPEEILSFFEQGHSVLIFNEKDELMSHAAGTYQYGDGSIELGAVFTAREHRGKGAATVAIKEAIKLLRSRYPAQKIFALANPASARIFEQIGATKMEAGELGDDVWEPCATCPKNPNFTAKGETVFHCCDTPYNLTQV